MKNLRFFNRESLNVRFFVIDLDRTIFATDLFFEAFETFLAKEYPNIAQKARNQQMDVEKNGDSFDVVSFLYEYLPHTEIQNISKKFLKECESNERDFALPGARELLKTLLTHTIPFGIYTYGHQEWQTLKMRAAGWDEVPCIVTDTPEKSRSIEAWKEGNLFNIPKELSKKKGMQAKEIWLLDDKARAFEVNDPAIRGFWICDATTEMLSSQKPREAKNAQTIRYNNLLDFIKNEIKY